MSKITNNKDGTVSIQFTKSELDKKYSEWDRQLDDMLKEKYTVRLPIYAIRLLLELVANQIIEYDYFLEAGIGVGGSDDFRRNAGVKIAKSLVGQLNKLGVNGDKELNDAIKKAENNYKNDQKGGDKYGQIK